MLVGIYGTEPPKGTANGGSGRRSFGAQALLAADFASAAPKLFKAALCESEVLTLPTFW